MNDILIKLLADWTAPDGVLHAKGSVLSFGANVAEEKALAGDLIVSGIGEKTSPVETKNEDNIQAKGIKDIVASTVAEAIKDLPTKAAKEMQSLHAKDLSDDDPTWGYMAPHASGKEHTTEEKQFGMWQFAKDVFEAATKGSVPERLMKCGERRKAMVEKAVKSGYIKAAESTSMIAGLDSDGGYSIPPEFNNMLLGIQDKVSIVRPRATTLTIGSNAINLPQFKDYDHDNNTVYGGVQAYFKAELAALTASKPTMENVELKLNALTALSAASHEMMTFSPQTASSLIQAMAVATAWKEDDKYLTGTGAGMPMGIVGHNATVTVAIESGQGVSTPVVTENVVKMFARNRMRSLASTAWIYNKADLFAALATLTLDVGTGGSTAGLITRVPGSPDNNLLGIPLVDTEHCPAAGTVGDIILADFSEYLIADHNSGADIARSMHLKFDVGQEMFRSIKYVDGQPRYSNVFTRQKSSNTVSPFVELAVRS